MDNRALRARRNASNNSRSTQSAEVEQEQEEHIADPYGTQVFSSLFSCHYIILTGLLLPAIYFSYQF